MPVPDAVKPVDVLLVTAEGCHFCDDALGILDQLAQSTPLAVRIVPLDSDEGRSLAVRYRVPFPPILLIDGTLFGHGRISRRKLFRLLAMRVDDHVG